MQPVHHFLVGTRAVCVSNRPKPADFAQKKPAKRADGLFLF